jgi:hypothetical protein
MSIRIKSGENVNIVIMDTPTCWIEGDDQYSYIETISDKLIKDLVLYSNHKFVESKKYINKKVYSLDGLDNEMCKYFENYGMWSKNYEHMLVVIFLDLENTIFEYESVSKETVDFLKSLDSIVFCPLPIWRSTILGSGIDNKTGLNCDFIEIRGNSGTQRCTMDETDTWRSILSKINDFMKSDRKRRDVFLEGFQINDRVLTPYLGT